jgi:hypothetical protein
MQDAFQSVKLKGLAQLVAANRKPRHEAGAISLKHLQARNPTFLAKPRGRRKRRALLARHRHPQTLFGCNEMVKIFGRFVDIDLHPTHPTGERTVFRSVIVADKGGAGVMVGERTAAGIVQATMPANIKINSKTLCKISYILLPILSLQSQLNRPSCSD